MEKKKSLLQKYEIALCHLDFKYIADCRDAREMEKIVQILRSGEEGYFPDLTKCAEDKLRELKPSSRLFRYEEPLRGRECLGSNEWKPIYDWTHDIKVKDQKLEALKANKDCTGAVELSLLPPVRRVGKIGQHKSEDESAKSGSNTTRTANAADKEATRIKSTDYRKWDQYDADVELLRMDLAEERVKEEVERKNRLNIQKSMAATPKVLEVDKEQELLKLLTEVEREHLAEEHRLRGNDYFRVKEYDNAIGEYSKAIQINPDSAAPAYNNRAIANIKSYKFLEAIDDCEKCLKFEPNNLKARLRHAEATYGYGRRRESYDLYLKVLELDPANAVALKATKEIRSQLGDLPPPSATRIRIQEEQPTTSKKSKTDVQEQKTPDLRVVKSNAKTPAGSAKPKNFDLADLIVPNRVVKSKLASAAEAFNSFRLSTESQKKATESKAVRTAAAMPRNEEPELRLPLQAALPQGKVLIEEI